MKQPLAGKNSVLHQNKMNRNKTNENILRTKLYKPRLSINHLHRQHLTAWLDRWIHRPLTLVSAPAGYGKSTLLSCWLKTLASPSAWISLDENDNDLYTFLSYLLAAIQTVFPNAVTCFATNDNSCA